MSERVALNPATGLGPGAVATVNVLLLPLSTYVAVCMHSLIDRILFINGYFRSSAFKTHHLYVSIV